MSNAGHLLHQQRHVPLLPGIGSAQRPGTGSSLAGDAYKTLPALRKAVPGQRAKSVLLRQMRRRCPKKADRCQSTQIQEQSCIVTLWYKKVLAAQPLFMLHLRRQCSLHSLTCFPLCVGYGSQNQNGRLVYSKNFSYERNHDYENISDNQNNGIASRTQESEVQWQKTKAAKTM